MGRGPSRPDLRRCCRRRRGRRARSWTRTRPGSEAGAVVEGERGDDEVTGGEVLHVGADFFDDADVLVADAADLVRVDAAVVPQVRAAHAAADDADDGVGRLVNLRVGALPE